jgi:hypothetical protein
LDRDFRIQKFWERFCPKNHNFRWFFHQHGVGVLGFLIFLLPSPHPSPTHPAPKPNNLFCIRAPGFTINLVPELVMISWASIGFPIIPNCAGNW